MRCITFVLVYSWKIASSLGSFTNFSAPHRQLVSTSSETKVLASVLGSLKDRRKRDKRMLHSVRSLKDRRRHANESSPSSETKEPVTRSYWKLDVPSTSIDVTLVIQTSQDRRWLLRHTCDRWPGPISIAVFVESGEMSEEQRANTEAAIVADCERGSLLMQQELVTGKNHTNAFSKQREPRSGKVSAQLVEFDTTLAEYPVNHLRNRAIAAVATSHFLLIDVDFVPSAELYSNLRSLGRSDPEVFRSPTQALVVPAFRIAAVSKDCKRVEHSSENGDKDPKCAPDFMMHTPINFSELLVCVAHNLCRPFDWLYNRLGHSTTDYPAFMTQGHIRPITCFDSNKYEPYLVLSKEGGKVPTYNEAFTGYGKNKIEVVMLLRAQGFGFSILPHAFLVHIPHVESKAKDLWKEHDDKKKLNGVILISTKTKLKDTLEKTPICRKHKAIEKYRDSWLETVKRAKGCITSFSMHHERVMNHSTRAELQKPWKKEPSSEQQEKAVEAERILANLRMYTNVIHYGARTNFNNMDSLSERPSLFFVPPAKTYPPPPCSRRDHGIACY